MNSSNQQSISYVQEMYNNRVFPKPTPAYKPNKELFFDSLIDCTANVWFIVKHKYDIKTEFKFFEQDPFLECYHWESNMISIYFQLDEIRLLPYSEEEIQSNINFIRKKYPDNLIFQDTKTFCILFDT
jgi:hypothetical protein